MKENKRFSKSDYDQPIERPFEELPEWFVRNLQARLVTKRTPKHRESGSDRVENAKFTAGKRRQNGTV